MKKNAPPANFDLHALEAFYRVLRSGSFSTAARIMGLAQPTVSQHVASLEDLLGVRLLDRAGRRATPTAAGRVLGDYAGRLLALREQATRAVAAAHQTVRGLLRVGASTIPGAYLLPEVVAAFRTAHPQVAVEVAIHDTRAIERGVAGGDLEFGVTGAPPSDRLLAGRAVWKDELVLVVPPDDPWVRARRRALSPKDLLDRPFVLREEGSGTLQTVLGALNRGRKLPRPLDVVCRLGSTDAVVAAVRRGIGVSIVSRKAAEPDLDRGTLHAIPLRGPKIVRDCFLVTRRRRTLSPTARAFIEVLEEVGAGTM